MAHPRLVKYILPLEKIEQNARCKHGRCAILYMQYITEHFMSYWRELQLNHSDDIRLNMWNEMYFIFNQQLNQAAEVRFDMYYMIFEHDQNPLFYEGHKIYPFWRDYKF